MKKHKNAEYIKVWADAPKSVLFQEDFGNGWSGKYTGENFDFRESNDYRIAPDCEYAMNVIHDLGGNEAVEIYQYWLNGGVIQFLSPVEDVNSFLLVQEDFEDYFPINAVRNPFKNFSTSLSIGEKFRKKVKSDTPPQY